MASTDKTPLRWRNAAWEATTEVEPKVRHAVRMALAEYDDALKDAEAEVVRLNKALDAITDEAIEARAEVARLRQIQKAAGKLIAAMTYDRPGGEDAVFSAAKELDEALQAAASPDKTPRMEVWVIQSENHLQRGSLAYWGPYDSVKQAEEEFAEDEGRVVVEVPAGG